MTASRPANEAIFHAARDIPDPDRRREFVREACGGDEARIAHVEALLAAADGPDSLLDRPAADITDATSDQPTTESSGRVIGPYKLIEPIGEGGMGSVWMAQQTEPVKRLVAVKLIKAGMDSRQVIARFEAERQALALMDHPNIARVLDGGTSSDGRPFFVMDLVKGVPITRYCDEHHLTPRQRLELFIPICQAVQHAHQKGIIHRDLKPSNVLVALYHGKPAPKIIDFGIAKAAGQQLTDKTLVTGFGAIVGTLEYMSPEQAEVNQLDIDTRSDIYSLGVLLYELLAGSPPFSRKELEKAGMLEMLRVIREQEPTKPSTKLSTADGLPTLAANRGTEPARLTRLVRGELDWIVMKALEKDRGRRYETANGFAMDVQRFLAGEPVLAAPATTVYRLRKFVNRHKGPVAAAGLVLLTLVAGIMGTTWGLMRAEHEQQKAVQERDAKNLALQAEQQARADETKARQQAFAALRSMTAEVVERKFEQGTVLTDDDRVFLRGVIAQFDAFAAIKENNADSREARAYGRYRVGAMHDRLGELKEAEQDFDQAVSIYQQLAADIPSRPEFRQALGRGHNNRGALLAKTGRLKEAEHDFELALNIQKQLATDFPTRPEFRQDVASSHNNRGKLLQDTGRLKEAEQHYDQALLGYQELTADFSSRPEFRLELAACHLNRGRLLSGTGRPKEAENDYDEAVSIFKHLAADFPSRPEYRQALAKSHNNRGALRRVTGRPKEAERDYDQSLTIRKQLVAEFPLRPEFRQDLATSHNNRGNLLNDTGRIKEAEQDYDQAVSIQKQLAADFPSRPEFRQALAQSHNNRGVLLRATGRPKDAEQDYDQALSIYKQLATDFPSQPEFRRELALNHNNRGNLLRDTGRLTEAEQHFDQAHRIRKQLVAEVPNQSDLRNDLAGSCLNLAYLQHLQGNLAAARRLLQEGRPHHLAALKANPQKLEYRRGYLNHLKGLIQVHAGLLEPEEAVRTAENCRDLGWNPPADAYNAACFLSLCIPIVAKHDKLEAKQRKEAAQFYGDAAMKFLRQAVSEGFKDVAHMKQDTDLAPLRQRDDFQKLVAELEAAAAPEKPPKESPH